MQVLAHSFIWWTNWRYRPKLAKRIWI